MDVIVEYKGSSNTRLIEQASVRRMQEYAESKLARMAKAKKPPRIPLIGSPNIDPMNGDIWDCRSYSDLKCWKNQRHARKNWGRHLHRWQPSARILADKCIYPNIGR